MGLFGGDVVRGKVKEIHKWDYINLADFKSSNCLTVMSYIWVWILALISVAVYAADTFTAVNLLAFNKGFELVEAWVAFKIQKWVFVGCILFSWALCAYEWVRAVRVMKRGSVTEDYLDPLAVELQCLRIPGGWRRFLVFAELTKSKQKAAWVAIFVYFQRKGALRILAAEGPRNVLNAFSIYAVARKKMHDENDRPISADSFIGQFIVNIKAMGSKNQLETVVFLSMTFTFIIWAIWMIFLIMALFFWLCFISHHVNKETLTGYCQRKVEARLARTVKAKTDKIWAKEQADIEKRKEKDKKSGKVVETEVDDDDDDPAAGGMKRQPTLPVFQQSPPSSDYLSRMDSVSTLPRYQSSPATPMEEVPPLPRQYSAQSSLLGNAQPMGQSNSYFRPGTSGSNMSYNSSRYVSPINTNVDDSIYPQNSRGTAVSTPSSSFESQRRQSPPSGMNGPWRSNQRYSDDEYELQESAPLPAALRPAAGRRDLSSPGPDRGPLPYPPSRSFTSPAIPMSGPARTGTPASQLPRSMTPAVNPIPRSMTPGMPSSARSMTPTGFGSLRSQNSGAPLYNQSPQSRRRPSDGSSGQTRWGSGGGPPHPGMAF